MANQPQPDSRSHQLFVISGRSQQDLEEIADDLAGELSRRSELHPADVAYTLQLGRAPLRYRGYAVCRELSELSEILTVRKRPQFWSREETSGNRPVAFLFPGVGGQYSGMGRDLYESEDTFRSIIDQSADILRELLNLDIRDVMFKKPDTAESDAPKRQLNLRKSLPAEHNSKTSRVR